MNCKATQYLFSYNGMLVTVTGTIMVADQQLPQDVPVILHVTHLKKLAETSHWANGCQFRESG